MTYCSTCGGITRETCPRIIELEDVVRRLDKRVRDLEMPRALPWFPSPIIQAQSPPCVHEFDMNSAMPTCRTCGAMYQRSEPYVRAFFVASGEQP